VRQGTKDCESPRLQGVIHEPPLTSWCRQPLPSPRSVWPQQGAWGARGTAQLLGHPLSAPKQVRRQSGEAHSPARKGQGGQAARGPNHKGKGRRGGGKRREVTQTDSCCPPSHVPHVGDTRHNGRSTNPTSLTGGCLPGANQGGSRVEHTVRWGEREGEKGTQRSAKCGAQRAGTTTARESKQR